MKQGLCHQCGRWKFAGERGTYGVCGLGDGDVTDTRRIHVGISTCERWLPRCCECGDPAYTEIVIYEDDEAPTSAWYCDDCADGLGIGRS